MAPPLNLHPLLFNALWTVGEPFLPDLFDLHGESQAALYYFAVLKLFFSKVTHHLGQFEAFLPVLDWG